MSNEEDDDYDEDNSDEDEDEGEGDEDAGQYIISTMHINTKTGDT